MTRISNRLFFAIILIALACYAVITFCAVEWASSSQSKEIWMPDGYRHANRIYPMEKDFVVNNIFINGKVLTVPLDSTFKEIFANDGYMIVVNTGSNMGVYYVVDHGDITYVAKESPAKTGIKDLFVDIKEIHVNNNGQMITTFETPISIWFLIALLVCVIALSEFLAISLSPNLRQFLECFLNRGVST